MSEEQDILDFLSAFGWINVGQYGSAGWTATIELKMPGIEAKVKSDHYNHPTMLDALRSMRANTEKILPTVESRSVRLEDKTP